MVVVKADLELSPQKTHPILYIQAPLGPKESVLLWRRGYNGVIGTRGHQATVDIFEGKSA